jgi:hypothetical protein
MTKLLAESLHEFREINKVEEIDPLLEDLNEGLNSKQQAFLSELVAKTELSAEDVEGKKGKFIDGVLKTFKLSSPGTAAGDLALKYRKQIMADKVKYSPYVLKFLKVYMDSLANKKAAKLFNFNPTTKKLDIRLGNVGKAGVGADLGQ